MSDETAPLTPPEEAEALAAEMALGLLDGPEAEAAVRRLGEDPAFADAVRAWQERLAGLAEGLTPVMAPARARQAIRERLGHAVAPLSNDPAARAPWWRGPVGAILGLLAVAAVVLVLILPGVRTDAPLPGYRADLVAAEANLSVSATARGREMEVALESGAAPAGRDWEIWWIEPDGGAVVSIGLVPREGVLRMTLPEGLELEDGVQIALSDEPEGGSPTGVATGPVVAVAPLTRL
ncbi:MAG: anti-sigma factor [Paracoccaceae bacterium]|nr:anti-sigma factor [Paracoccaceae bacterium]